MKRSIKIAAIGLLLTLASLSAYPLSDNSINGQVVDQATGKPVGGALVVMTWLGDVPTGPDSNTRCFHVETSISDVLGNFKTRGWSKYSLKTIFAALRRPTAHVYKSGYVFSAIQSTMPKTLVMVPFVGTKNEYIEVLFKFPSCHSGWEDEKSLYYVYRMLADEAEPLAETREQKVKVEALRRLADQTLVDHSKPTEFVGGYLRNVEKSDNYKIEEIAE